MQGHRRLYHTHRMFISTVSLRISEEDNDMHELGTRVARSAETASWWSLAVKKHDQHHRRG